MLNHCIVHFKYFNILFVSHTSVKLNEMNQEGCGVREKLQREWNVVYFDDNVRYLDCVSGFTSIYICQDLSNCIF